VRNLDCSSALSIRIFLSVFGYCIVDSLTAFSVICNKTFYKVYTLLSHTPHHTKSPLGSRGRDRDLVQIFAVFVCRFATCLRVGRV